jgi:hypothetical protein
MKKISFMVILVVLVSTTLLFPKKKFSLLAGFGVPFSGDEGFLILYGTEMALSEKIHLQLLGVSNLENQEGPVKVGTAGLGLSSLDLLGILKMPVSSRVKLFAKAGILFKFTNHIEPPYGYTGTLYVTWQGFPYIKKKGGLGAGMGVGMEYSLGNKVALMGGCTFRTLFGKGSKSELDNFKQWYTVYAGLRYQL